MTAPQPRFGRYEVTRELGSGTAATVYRAFDQESRREVALKALAPDLAADPERRQAYLSGARALQALRHANLVPVYDVGEANGRPFFTMELVRGRTLAQSLAGDARLPYGRLVEVFRGVCAAVDYLHRAGRQHGAISPANIMVKDSGRAVLMDPLVGVDPLGGSDDLAALGALAETLIAGASGAELQGATLREIQPGLPEQVYTAIEGALSVGSAARPGSAGEIATAVAAATPILSTLESSTETMPVLRRAARVVEPARTGLRPLSTIPPAAPSGASSATPPVPPTAPASATPAGAAPAAPASASPAEPPASPLTRPLPNVDETVQVPALGRTGSRPLPPPAAVPIGNRRSRLPLYLAGTAVLVVVVAAAGFAFSRGGSGTAKRSATAVTRNAAGVLTPVVSSVAPAARPSVSPAAQVASPAPSSTAPSPAPVSPTAPSPAPATAVTASVLVPTSSVVASPGPNGAGAVQEIMTDNKFTPADLTGVAGRPLILNVVNQGKAVHNFHVTSLNGDDGREIKTDLLEGGQSATITFTISAKGVYSYRCDVHPDEMRGSLTVSGQ